MLQINQDTLPSIKLMSLDKYFDEMINLYDTKNFPRVMLLSGNKGIGKFTLVFHFLNYIYTKEDNNKYNFKEKSINVNSNFYNLVLNQSFADVIFFQAAENKNIKIEDVRNLKSTLSKTTLTKNPRFIIIDEVEFLNTSSANALLKTLEEPSGNNFFILIDNQQSELIQTISSRCLKNNIYLNYLQKKKITDYLIKHNKINPFIDNTNTLTPGLLLKYSELSNKHKIDLNENILLKLNKLLYAYKKDKDNALIKMTFFFINQFFYQLEIKNENKIFTLSNLRVNIANKVNNFTLYNLNLNSVLNSIELQLKNVR